MRMFYIGNIQAIFNGRNSLPCVGGKYIAAQKLRESGYTITRIGRNFIEALYVRGETLFAASIEFCADGLKCFESHSAANPSRYDVWSEWEKSSVPECVAALYRNYTCQSDEDPPKRPKRVTGS